MHDDVALDLATLRQRRGSTKTWIFLPTWTSWRVMATSAHGLIACPQHE